MVEISKFLLQDFSGVKSDAQALFISGGAKQVTSLQDINKIATSLTTLAQEQKNRTGSTDIRITNSLISELSNLASVGTTKSRTLLSSLSSGINTTLKSLLSRPVRTSAPQVQSPRPEVLRVNL